MMSSGTADNPDISDNLNTEDGQGWDTAGQGYQGSGQDWEPGTVHSGKYWSDGFRTSIQYLKLFSEPIIWEIENIGTFSEWFLLCSNIKT